MGSALGSAQQSVLASWVSLLVDGGVSSKGRALLLPLLDCKDYTGISKLQGRGEAGVEAPSFDTKRRPLNQSGSFLGWWITICSRMRKLRPHFCVKMSWRVWRMRPGQCMLLCRCEAAANVCHHVLHPGSSTFNTWYGDTAAENKYLQMQIKLHLSRTSTE